MLASVFEINTVVLHLGITSIPNIEESCITADQAAGADTPITLNPKPS